MLILSQLYFGFTGDCTKLIGFIWKRIGTEEQKGQIDLISVLIFQVGQLEITR